MNESLAYIQEVLCRVRFDKDPFEKVLIESAAGLDEHSLMVLQSWCEEEFGPESSAMTRSFNEITINQIFNLKS